LFHTGYRYDRYHIAPFFHLATATAKWRQMGVRSVHEALGVYTHDVHRRWGSVRFLAVVGARHPSAAACPSLGGRTPTSFYHHGPPPAYAQSREAVGGAAAWPQVHPGVVRGARAAAGL
jgi:hypothetical protein